jgi:transcriptional regulator with XRE-family HTH domain
MSYLGNNIRRLRKEKGLSIAELARLSKASPASISQIETGKRDATFKLILNIAYGLGIEVGQLVTPLNEGHFTHDIKSVIKFSDKYNLITGKSTNKNDNHVFWVGVFNLHNEGELIEAIHISHNIGRGFEFIEFFNEELNDYLIQQRLRILLWKCVELHKTYSEIKAEGIDWKSLIDIIINLSNFGNYNPE